MEFRRLLFLGEVAYHPLMFINFPGIRNLVTVFPRYGGFRASFVFPQHLLDLPILVKVLMLIDAPSTSAPRLFDARLQNQRHNTPFLFYLRRPHFFHTVIKNWTPPVASH